ncbi:hypothetical protein [Streptomyces sp. NBC_01497]|uniref:hypothetical protein n=1 Tax=Streptomyces sp. NBC_01497 TaxID=2903885 RepID=UPI002E3685B0|nr:hypothetical protein [Streptomyces sp. NBC_01497]
MDVDRRADGTATRLHIALDPEADGSAPTLTTAQRHELAAIGAENGRGAAAGKAKGPATLRCDKNPHWSDARGRLDKRFNCHHSTVNWGYRISAGLRSVITGRVAERGTSWWKNGRHMPKNAPHTVARNYHFHGTFEPVGHGSHVQSQDYMTFRVTIGGRTGTGTLTWTSNVKTKK